MAGFRRKKVSKISYRALIVVTNKPDCWPDGRLSYAKMIRVRRARIIYCSLLFHTMLWGVTALFCVVPGLCKSLRMSMVSDEFFVCLTTHNSTIAHALLWSKARIQVLLQYEYSTVIVQSCDYVTSFNKNLNSAYKVTQTLTRQLYPVLVYSYTHKFYI